MILIKIKNINDFFFQIITNKLTMINYFNDTNNIKNIYNLISYVFLMSPTTIFIIEKKLIKSIIRIIKK